MIGVVGGGCNMGVKGDEFLEFSVSIAVTKRSNAKELAPSLPKIQLVTKLNYFGNNFLSFRLTIFEHSEPQQL